MAKTYNPSSHSRKFPTEILPWAQSVHKILTGSVDMGIPNTQTPASFGINAGVYNTFGKGNGSGILVRITAHGVSGTGAPYSWPGAGGVTISHGLGRQPVGFHVVDSDKDVRVFRTAAPNAKNITLAPTDNTASVTVYIF